MMSFAIPIIVFMVQNITSIITEMTSEAMHFHDYASSLSF